MFGCVITPSDGSSLVLAIPYRAILALLCATAGTEQPGEMKLASPNWQVHRVCRVAGLLMLAALAPTPAWADFFDGARRTFQTDIPHFFQDDIPCAFGGQPTSHTKASCKSPDPASKRAPAKTGDSAAVPPGKTKQVRDAPANSDR